MLWDWTCPSKQGHMGLTGVTPSRAWTVLPGPGDGGSPDFTPCSGHSSLGKTMSTASQCVLPRWYFQVSPKSWAETHLAVEKPTEGNKFYPLWTCCLLGQGWKLLNPSHKTPLKVTPIHARGAQDGMRSSFQLVSINIFVLLIQH